MTLAEALADRPAEVKTVLDVAAHHHTDDELLAAAVYGDSRSVELSAAHGVPPLPQRSNENFLALLNRLLSDSANSPIS